jgi:hypothetical protein
MKLNLYSVIPLKCNKKYDQQGKAVVIEALGFFFKFEILKAYAKVTCRHVRHITK